MLFIWLCCFILFGKGLSRETSAWEQIRFINLKNNKITDIGSLPASWPCLEKLYLGK